MSTASKTGPASARTHANGELIEIGKTILYALLIALVLRVVLFQPFTIPSASMEPTLLEGDYIIVSKYSYGFSRYSLPLSPPGPHGRLFMNEPHRGDIIVFKLPRDPRMDYIKRLVGLPGDTVQVRHGTVFINGQPIPQKAAGTADIDIGGFQQKADKLVESLKSGLTYTTYQVNPDDPAENTEPFMVPKGEYFFMGDNRDNSLDSRFSPDNDGVGFVPAENLEGKAELILLSWRKGASLFKPWTWVLNARTDRLFHYLY
jgi:signal peptidase I